MILAVILLCAFALFLALTADMHWLNRASLGAIIGAWVLLILIASGAA